MSEALIFVSTTHNITTDCALNYKFNTWKFLVQNIGRTCCVQKLFLTFRTISVHNMFSPCSAKRRASDKDLPVTTTIKHDIFYASLKVRQFQNEFMKSSFLPKYKQKLSGFLPFVVKAEIWTIFGSYFGRNDDFINSFWNCLTFRMNKYEILHFAKAFW